MKLGWTMLQINSSIVPVPEKLQDQYTSTINRKKDKR